MSTYIQDILDYLNGDSDPDVEPASYTSVGLDDEIVSRVQVAAGEAGDAGLVRACDMWLNGGEAAAPPFRATQINITEGADIFGPNVEDEKQLDALIAAYTEHAENALAALLGTTHPGCEYEINILRVSGACDTTTIYAQGDVEAGESAEVLVMDDDPRAAALRDDIRTILGEAFETAWETVAADDN